ncbi:MAG: hypothetical protein M5U22_04440 [Thermoleophilia bacterium]|nr:hypothetical protein [Thermoleophilia bacterium]
MLSVCLVTVGVDPANLFRGTGYERGIAELLAQGRNVAAIANHDDRLVQRYYAAKVERAPDVLVLGSSRAMQIRRDDAAAAGLGPTFFNASVSEGTLEDFEAILELYLKRGFIPHTVVLGVDIWDLQATDWLAGWKSLRWERDSLLEEMGRDPGADPWTAGASCCGMDRLSRPHTCRRPSLVWPARWWRVSRRAPCSIRPVGRLSMWL